MYRINQSSLTPLYGLLGILFGLLLTGCTITADLNILQDEQWEGTTVIEIAPWLVEAMGGIEEIEKNMEVEGDVNAEDFRIEETSDGGIRMIANSSGQGIDSLKEMFGEDATISTDEQGHVTIRSIYEYEEEGAFELGSSVNLIMRISGSEIIASNADRIEGGTAIWEKPELIEVELVPGTALNEQDTAATAQAVALAAEQQAQAQAATAQAVALAAEQQAQAEAATAQAQVAEATIQARVEAATEQAQPKDATTQARKAAHTQAIADARIEPTAPAGAGTGALVSEEQDTNGLGLMSIITLSALVIVLMLVVVGIAAFLLLKKKAPTQSPPSG